jgi:protein-disulfide isomerase
MADKDRTKRIIAWVVLPVFVLVSGAIWLAKFHGPVPVSAAIAADISQAEFEQHVKSYLLEHPEVVGEALSRLEAKQGELDAAAAQAILKAHTADVFHDPDSPISGNPNGDVTLVEFFDYNCPYCHSMAPLITQAETADPKLRIVYKEFPILGPGSLFAARAALAANRQGKYVAFHRALYAVRGQIDEAKVLEIAATIGVDVGHLKADMQDKTIQAALDKNAKLGEALHITGTPGFVIGDQVTTGAMDFAVLKSLIAKVRSADATK